MRIQQRNVEKIHRRLNGYNKRQTGIHSQRIRFSILTAHIIKDGFDYEQADFVGQNTSMPMPLICERYRNKYLSSQSCEAQRAMQGCNPRGIAAPDE